MSDGLEFGVVILPSVEENVLPHFHAVQDGQDAIDGPPSPYASTLLPSA
jgi:hypothetical protein